MARCGKVRVVVSLVPLLALLVGVRAGDAAVVGPFGMVMSLQVDGQEQLSHAPVGYLWALQGNVYHGWVPDVVNFGDWSLDSLSITGDPDPVVTNNLAVTNNSNVAQIFTATITLPLHPAAGYSATIGSTGGSVTNQQGSGSATVSNVLPDAIYTALIDGSIVEASLLTGSTTASGPFSTAAIGPANFSNPNNSGSANSIGIQLKFSLTPGDSASFTSVFAIVPEPAAITLVGTAVLGLIAWRWRRT